MLKSLKYQGHVLGTMFLTLAGAGAVGLFLCLIMFGKGDDSAMRIVAIVESMILIMGFAVQMSYFAYYADIAISMGASRKHYFISAQIIKLVTAVLCLVEILVIDFVQHKLLDNPQFFTNGEFIAVVFFVILLLICAGESIGVICNRFGRIGMVVYMGACMVLGAFVGFAFVTGTLNDSEILYEITAKITENYMVPILIMLAVSACITAVDYVWSRKLTVKG
ncbi:MAG: hypothetical protein RSF00_02935 [Oscillospiraceae bacterium]